MNYIVLDLEWNQSSTGKEPEIQTMPFEIIEIGALKLNNEKSIVGEFDQLIRPMVYRELYRFTSQLVQMRMEELERVVLPVGDGMTLSVRKGFGNEEKEA